MQMGQKKRDKNPNVSQVCHVYGIPTDARQREQCHEGKRTIKQIDERKREGTEEEATINDLLFFILVACARLRNRMVLRSKDD